MWWQILIAIVLAAVVLFFVRLFLYSRRFWRMTEFLHADVPEMMKRLEDETIDDFLLTKYRERGTLFHYQLLKMLRERIAAATDEKEKEFFQKVSSLMELGNDTDWRIMTSTRVKGVSGWILWRLGLRRAEEETALKVSVRRKFHSGSFEETYSVSNLPESVLVELNGLNSCR